MIRWGRSSIFAAALVLLFNVFPLSAQEKLEKITLAIPVHALSQLPAYVGVRFGLFREEGLDVQIVQMRTALVGPALISRELDFATAAYYNGDYSKSLQAAQMDKHRWVFEGIGFQPKFKVIDIGCGCQGLFSRLVASRQ
jgi:hypothetical protein